MKLARESITPASEAAAFVRYLSRTRKLTYEEKQELLRLSNEAARNDALNILRGFPVETGSCELPEDADLFSKAA